MSRVSSPSITISLKMARNRQSVTEQLVEGLVMGAMLGPGLIIVSREANRIEFKKAGGIFQKAPDRGEILISDEETGETKIECKIWCDHWRPTFLAMVLTLVIGLLLQFHVPFSWGGREMWGGHFNSALAGFFVVVFSLVLGTWGRAQLRHQLEAYLHNLIYLKVI